MVKEAWASKRFSTNMANDDEPKNHLFGIKNLSHMTLLKLWHQNTYHSKLVLPVIISLVYYYYPVVNIFHGWW